MSLRKSLYFSGVRPFLVNFLAAASAWLSSTSQTAITSPKLAAPAQSPVPCPPQPTSATPGRSLGPSGLGWAAWASSSSRNHSGTPVAAVMAAVVLRKRRRLMLKVFGVMKPIALPSHVGVKRESDGPIFLADNAAR